MINPEELEADANKPQGDLNQVIEKGNELINLKRSLADLEDKAKAVAEKIRQIETQELPEIMENCNVDKFEFGNGYKVQVNSIIKASLPAKSAIDKEKDEERKAELEHRLNQGLKWLRENGGTEIIKNVFAVEFSKGQDNIVGDFVGRAEELKLPYQRQQSVHPSNLSRFVKEKMQKGDNVPKEALGVYCGKQAVVKKSS